MSDLTITSACPNCGTEAERDVYDIGSGPELSCASCEWCWGAEGQPLKPLDIKSILAHVAEMQQVVEETRRLDRLDFGEEDLR